MMSPPSSSRTQRWRTPTGTRIAPLLLMFAGSGVTADTDIHRCLLEDGTIAFQEMPCPEPVESVENSSETIESDSDAEEDNFANPYDAPDEPTTPSESTLPVSQDRAECEKITRDAIDEIDLEMRAEAYTKEQGDEYLAQLLPLTRQLRNCKQL